MDRKTEVHAEDDQHDLIITRTFDLPLELLFQAYVDPDILAQWMGTHVLKFEGKRHGSYQFETVDPKGNKHRFNGVIHAFVPNQSITRTFEMENTPFGVQLELYSFEKLTDETSKLTMHVIYESVAQRDQVLQMPFVKGINMAHKRLEEVARARKNYTS